MAHYDDASMFSDLSSLDGSDEFGRKLLQHTKDAQRISTLQAFKRAKPLPRAALNLDNLERNNINNPPSYLPDQYRPPSASGSSASDPPLNPPRAWGRKGRPNHAWMRNIYSDNLDNANSSPNVDWLDAANSPLNTSAYLSPSQRHSHLTSTPTALDHQESRLDEWDPENDFSAASLLASTPAISSRSRLTIDQIRESELQTAEKRPFASSLRQAWEKTTSETNRHYGDSPAQISSSSRSISAPGFNANIANKENIPIQSRESPRALYKNAASSERLASNTPQPAQRRADSMALLRKLSRTPSASPSPTSAKEVATSNRPPRPESSWADKHPKTSSQPLFDTNSPQAPEVVRGPEFVRPSQGDSSLAPEAVQGPGQHPPASLITPARPADRNLPLKTPVVMGAWVDTPQTARQPSDHVVTEPTQNGHKVSDTGVESPSSRTIREPDLPVSALDAVLKDLRAGKRREEDDPTLGDSTIASLEEVMNPSADTTMRLELPDVPSAQPQTSESNTGAKEKASDRTSNRKSGDDDIDIVPTTQNDRDQRQKWFAVESLKKRLAGTSAGQKVDKQAEKNNSLKDAIASAVTSGSTSKSDLIRHSHLHSEAAAAQCNQCGRPTSVLGAAWNEYWSLYFKREPQSLLGFRTTWLGLICTLFWTWLITELLLSSIFSPPKYATRMRGFGVDPHAPRFPYVLPTLVLRPLGPILTPIASMATWLWKVLLGQEQYKYYPANPGGWGSAARVKIGPPGPGSAYSTNRVVNNVQWEDQQATAEAWHTGQENDETNTRNDRSGSWEYEVDSSMSNDELV